MQQFDQEAVDAIFTILKLGASIEFPDYGRIEGYPVDAIGNIIHPTRLILLGSASIQKEVPAEEANIFRSDLLELIEK